MVSQKGANALMCVDGAASDEVTGELGRWFRARSRLGWAAARRRSGADGETVAESVPAVAREEVGCSAEVGVMFLVGYYILFLVLETLWLARRDEGGAGGSRGVCKFVTGSGGQRVFSCTSPSLGTGIWTGNSTVP